MTMKKPIVALALSGLCVASAAEPLSEASEGLKTFSVGSQPMLEVSNIWGDVTIVSGPPGEIEVAFESIRSAADARNFERSRSVLPLTIEQDGNAVIARVGRQHTNNNYEPNCRRCKLDVQFTITVPQDADIDASTINDGSVTVNDVGGTVSASNINGPIHIAGLERCGDINSINGAVLLDYKIAPDADCAIRTINGDIIVGLPTPPALDLAIDLANGKVRSEFDVAAMAIPATVEQRSRGDKTIYNIEQMAGLRIGSGGATLKITSMNGNVQIARSKNDD
ncbi:MAG: hypothetical protein AB8G17_04360 [Gammaproteobacteria bacterium]